MSAKTLTVDDVVSILTVNKEVIDIQLADIGDDVSIALEFTLQDVLPSVSGIGASGVALPPKQWSLDCILTRPKKQS